MRAALLEKGSTELHVVDDLLVREPLEGEVAVRVAFCGLCHSDLTVIDNYADDAPIVLGHEAAGVVEAVGRGVTGVAPGDRVVLSTKLACGRCYWCARGRHSVCELNSVDSLDHALPSGVPAFTRRGRHVARGLAVAGLSELTLTTPMGLVKVADDTPLDIASLLGCGVRTGIGAVLNTAEVEPGSSCLVMGLGGVGLSVVLGAVAASASTIIAIDPVSERRELAGALGADVLVDPGAEDIDAAVQAATAGRGVDYAFDAVGAAELLQACFRLVGRGGAAVVVGVNPREQFVLPALPFVGQEKRVLGCLVGSSLARRDIPRFLEMQRAGRLPFDRLVTTRRPLVDVNAGFDDMREGRGARTLIDFAA